MNERPVTDHERELARAWKQQYFTSDLSMDDTTGATIATPRMKRSAPAWLREYVAKWKLRESYMSIALQTLAFHDTPPDWLMSSVEWSFTKALLWHRSMIEQPA